MRETKDLWNMPIDLSSDSAAAILGMAAAPEMGGGMKKRWLFGLGSALRFSLGR